MTYIKVKNLQFSYGSRKVINDLSLEFSLGEQVALIGRNGAGKTTLAKLLIRMLEPQQGEILIEGESTRKKTIADVAKEIGFVFQNPNQMLFSNSVEKELALSLQRFTLSKEEKKEKIEQMLNFFNLTSYREKHPRLLSRGEKQKLAIATVLIQEPKALILDEPYSGIDFTQRALIMSYIEELKLQGKLIIIITHDLETILETCERIIALVRGSMAYNGPSLDFFMDRTWLPKVGLEETPMLSMLYSLQEHGLTKNILRKNDLIQFLKEKIS